MPIRFDSTICPQCILRMIKSDPNKLCQFVRDFNLDRLELWLQLVEAGPNEDDFAALLWLIAPVVYYAIQGNAEEETRDWFSLPRVRHCLHRSFSIRRTRKFGTRLADAVEWIERAGDLLESREEVLRQMDVRKLRRDLSLSKSILCCHLSDAEMASTVSGITLSSQTFSGRGSPIADTSEFKALSDWGSALSDWMEVDPWITPTPTPLVRFAGFPQQHMREFKVETPYHSKENMLELLLSPSRGDLTPRLVPGNARAVLRVHSEKVSDPERMEIDDGML